MQTEAQLEDVKDDAVQDRAQPSFSAVFQCSPSVSAPVLSVQPSFSAACFQCSLLSIQPSFSAAFFQCSPSFRAPVLSMQPSFNAAFFQCSPSFTTLSLQPALSLSCTTASLSLSFTAAFTQSAPELAGASELVGASELERPALVRAELVCPILFRQRWVLILFARG